MMKTIITFWVEDENPTPGKFIRRKGGWVDWESPEYECVNDWYPLLLAKGTSNITKTIVELWKGVYPERADNDKFYSKLMKSIDWWNYHTDMRNAQSNRRLICTREVEI